MEFQYQSEKIDKILPKFFEAQYDMRTGLIKDSKGGRGKYVRLEHILLFCYEKLKPYKLTLRLYQADNNNNIYLCASVIDNDSLQFFSTYHFLYKTENIGLDTQQKIGGDNTYASRYAIKTLFGLPMFDENDPDYGKDTQDAEAKPEVFSWHQLPGCITKEDDDKLYAMCGRDTDIKKEVVSRMKVRFSCQILKESFPLALKLAETLVKQKEQE